MANLLDIQVESLTPQSVASFERIATVDVQPHYFSGLPDRVDLVIDHHPEQPGYNAVFKDIRADYGSTCTILTEHLRAVDWNISERTATAMLYAIKSDALFFARHTNRVDLEAFTFLYPLSDPALIRKLDGAEITMERLGHVLQASSTGRLQDQVFCAFRTRGLAKRAQALHESTDYFVVMRMAASHGPFQTACDLRGTEAFLVDMGLNPEFAQALLDRIATAIEGLLKLAMQAAGKYFDMVELRRRLCRQHQYAHLTRHVPQVNQAVS